MAQSDKKSDCEALMEGATALLAARSQEAFFTQLAGLQAQWGVKYANAQGSPAKRLAFQGEVDSAFASAGANQRLRRGLQAILLPGTSAMPLACANDEQPEFLWTFTLPVRITFGSGQLTEPVISLNGAFAPLEYLLPQLEACQALPATAILAGFSSLYRREDFYAYGPFGLTQAFARAELEPEFEPPVPSAILLDSAFPGHRTVTAYLVMVAQLPEGESRLFLNKKLPASLRSGLESMLEATLRRKGLDIATVEVDQLSFLSEAYLHSAGAPARELVAHVKCLRQEFGGRTKLLAHVPAPGRCEINVVDEDGNEFYGIPAFGTLEPPEVLRGCLEQMGSQLGMPLADMQAGAPGLRSLFTH